MRVKWLVQDSVHEAHRAAPPTILSWEGLNFLNADLRKQIVSPQVFFLKSKSFHKVSSPEFLSYDLESKEWLT